MDNENICARCSCVLISGKHAFFEIKIEAIADPGTPDLADLDEAYDDPKQAYLDLISELENVSPQEAMDGVAASRVIFLCGKCFPGWMERPADIGQLPT